MKTFAGIFAVLCLCLSLSTQAANYSCTKWTKQNNISCSFGGDWAEVYARQCENPCGVWGFGNSNFGPHCDLLSICIDTDPNELTEDCSPWKKEDSVSCYNPNSNSFQQKWVRACTVGLADTWCSDKNPNDL